MQEIFFWPKRGPVPQLRRRPTGTGHLGLYSLKPTIDHKRPVISLLTFSRDVAEARRVAVLQKVLAGESAEEIRAWLLAVGRTDLDNYIAEQIEQATEPGDIKVGTVADLANDYVPEDYARQLKPARRANQLEGLLRAAQAAIVVQLDLDLPSGVILDRTVLRQVPLRWINPRALGAATRVARTADKGPQREAALRRQANLHYSLRSLFSADYIDSLGKKGVNLPEGLANLLELAPVGAKPQLTRPVTLEHIRKLCGLLADEARNGRLPWIVVLALFAGADSRTRKIASKACFSAEGQCTLPDRPPLGISPGAWRWLNRYMPKDPLTKFDLRLERTAACELLRSLGIVAWQRDPLLRLQHLGYRRLSSLNKSAGRLMRSLGIRTADHFIKNFWRQRLGAQALGAFTALDQVLDECAK